MMNRLKKHRVVVDSKLSVRAVLLVIALATVMGSAASTIVFIASLESDATYRYPPATKELLTYLFLFLPVACAMLLGGFSRTIKHLLTSLVVFVVSSFVAIILFNAAINTFLLIRFPGTEWGPSSIAKILTADMVMLSIKLMVFIGGALLVSPAVFGIRSFAFPIRTFQNGRCTRCNCDLVEFESCPECGHCRIDEAREWPLVFRGIWVRSALILITFLFVTSIVSVLVMLRAINAF